MLCAVTHQNIAGSVDFLLREILPYREKWNNPAKL